MPLKVDGMPFELHPGPQKDEQGNAYLYARPAPDRRIKMDEVDEFCAKYRGMSRGQMTSAMTCFIDVVRHWLVDGHRVETPIGVFAPRLKLKGRFTDPKKVRNSDVCLDGIDFTPSKDFESEVRDVLYYGFRRASLRVGNKQMYDEAKMTRALEKCLRVYGDITISGFQDWSGLRYHSAKKYLDSLCEGNHPRLRKRKIGTTFQYLPFYDDAADSPTPASSNDYAADSPTPASDSHEPTE